MKSGNPAKPFSRPADTGRDRRRKRMDGWFSVICLLVSGLSFVILLSLLGSLVAKGSMWIDWQFLTAGHQENQPLASGIGPSIVGSVLICLICGLVALPIGVGTAVFLEEFPPRTRIIRFLHNLVQLNITNLAGVPSIVYGILGVTAFVYMFGAFGRMETGRKPPLEFGSRYLYQTRTLAGTWVTFPAEDESRMVTVVDGPRTVSLPDGSKAELVVLAEGDPAPVDPALLARTVRAGNSASLTRSNYPWYLHLPLHKSLLAAGLTLSLVIMPIIIIASQESLRAVPGSIREAAFGLGATRWQVVRKSVIPAAMPGIMTGAILAISRALGEAAPLLAVMGAVVSTSGLTSLMDKTPTLPVTIFRWSHDENHYFENNAAAAILVLLMILLLINSIAILIRYRAEKQRG